MEQQIIYLCEDTPDGIFSAIYDAWKVCTPKDLLSIKTERFHEIQLFANYIYVKTDLEKATKVARSVVNKIGQDVYETIYKVALSYEEDKIDVIYHFLKLGFQYGSAALNMHGLDVVCRVFEIRRNVWNEAHSFREFVRFHETAEGILLSRIRPKNQVLPILAYHFSDRFPEEDFVILDETHEMGLFHEKRKQWYLAPLERNMLEKIWEYKKSAEYEKMWKTFFQTIAIEVRRNDRCQRNMCALRYRDYMIEFD